MMDFHRLWMSYLNSLSYGDLTTLLAHDCVTKPVTWDPVVIRNVIQISP